MKEQKQKVVFNFGFLPGINCLIFTPLIDRVLILTCEKPNYRRFTHRVSFVWHIHIKTVQKLSTLHYCLRYSYYARRNLLYTFVTYQRNRKELDSF